MWLGNLACCTDFLGHDFEIAKGKHTVLTSAVRKAAGKQYTPHWTVGMRRIQ